ncbi:MAG: leucyl aminopeptidase [Clostridiales bacterium]|nr:leucyl aminopeptidase [Clostridiales bacterium]
MIQFTQEMEHADIEICGMFEETQDIIPHLFYGKEGQVCIFPSDNGLKLFLGLGNKNTFTPYKIRNIYAKAMKEIKKYSLKQIKVNVIPTQSISKKSMLKAMLEGIYLSDYEYQGYRTEQVKQVERTVAFCGFEDMDDCKRMIVRGKNLMDSINDARDLICSPPNYIYPEMLAEHVQQLSVKSGFEVEILEEAQIEQLGMHAFLEVAKGSARRPRLIVMRYTNSKGPVLGLVGKGITFDTGGYCLKPSSSMKNMKTDMAGAATVIAIMNALAKNRCTVNVKAVIACCENALSGGSYMPSDVITSMSQKTVEVVNTDAEGRLTLADALTYIIDVEKAEQVIDIATLTGQAVRTFGSLYTPAFTNDDTFFMQFMEAAKEVGEDYWKMPCDDRYRSYFESKIADMKNSGEAGTITAAMFLKEFVKDTPWIHLDIAGTVEQHPSVFEYAVDCPSGVAIRTIYEMVQREYV